MNAIKKIAYIALCLSLFPLIGTYFAYGSVLELIYMAIMILVVIGLLYLTFSQSKVIASLVFFISTGLFIIQLVFLRDIWFNSEGVDQRLTFFIMLQTILIAVVLFFLLRESKMIEWFNKRIVGKVNKQ